jgi:hypothetical protein
MNDELAPQSDAMTTERNWSAEPLRQPKEKDGDTVLFSECGRVLNNTCYRSHWFKLVSADGSCLHLLVRHGGGDEHINLTWNRRVADTLRQLDSDSRYLLLHSKRRLSPL